MRYLQHVSANLKKGVDSDLGKLTLICGPNGGGKTSHLQAIHLACRGEACEAEGRNVVKQQRAIARLFPQSALRDGMYATVRVSDGTTLRWSAEVKKGGEVKIKERGGGLDVRFVVADIDGLLLGSDVGIRQWIEERVAQQGLVSELLDLLPGGPAQRKLFEALAKRTQARTPLDLAAEARAEARSIRVKATQKEKTGKQMTGNLPPPVGEETIASWEAQLEALRAEAAAAARPSPPPPAAPIPQESPQQMLLAQALRLAEAHQRHFAESMPGMCMVCGRDGAGIEDFQAQLRQLLPEVSYTLPTPVAPPMPEPAPSVQHEAMIALSAQIADAKRVRTSWVNQQRLRQDIAADRQRADLFSDGAKVLEEEGKKLVEKRVQAYEAQVGRWLPPRGRFSLDLENGRIAIEQDGEVCTDLSGAERAGALLAIAAEESKACSGALCVLAPKDVGWHEDMLADTMAALAPLAQQADYPVQIILMATVLPNWKDHQLEAAQAWTIVRL